MRNPAPEFPADLDWVNVSTPPHLAHLRGRVVLLWFFSYDNVNCWNVVPDIAWLEKKYSDGLTAIGMHCPKYPVQRGNDAVLRAVNRLRLRHAVANDATFRVWEAYAITAWPTAALIDAEGRLAAVFAGEGRRDEIDARVGELLDEAAAHDVRVYEPALPASRPEPRRALAFPTDIVAEGQRLYVADSGHNRVLECDISGRVLRYFGSGSTGFVDGTAGFACFNQPCGLARWRNFLYVADSANHAVRRIDLGKGSVDTVLGVGSGRRSRPDGAESEDTSLNTPLGVAVVDDDLFITVGGQHQIWRLDLAVHQVSVFAGSGELGLLDGAANDARFAQPSGLDVLGRQLLVVDAASSSLRSVDIDSGEVNTVLGAGLYEFGDTSGARDAVRLQNPLSAAADQRGIVYIADSYNDTIKVLNQRSGEVRPLRTQYRLHEPHRLSLSERSLWIANTNLHEIACLDLPSGAIRRVPVGE